MVVSNLDLSTGAWFGDRSMTLNFPSQWDVTILGNDLLPSLSIEQIKEKIENPIGSERLGKLVSGKNKVVIVVDDLTRPTPASSILPSIIQELEKGGVKNDSIAFVIAGATHSPASEREIELKLGEVIARNFKVFSHDARRDVVFLEKSSRGLPIYVNKHVVEADFVIGIGCIYPHPAAGFSGGAKIIAPGVCGSETVRYLHDYIKSGTRGVFQPDIEFNQETLNIANKAGLNFIVNVVLNQKREIAGLFAGDKVHAHAAGCKYALDLFSVESLKNDTDVVVVDAYPFDMSIQFAKDRGLWPFEGLRNNVSKVVIADFPEGLGGHVLYPVNRQFTARLFRRIKNIHPKDFRFLSCKFNAIKRLIYSKQQRILFLSNGITSNEIKSVFPKANVFDNWDGIVNELNMQHKDLPIKVVVYRCASYLMAK